MNHPPKLRIRLDTDTPVYRQIADALRATLVAGSFAPGDRLPTVRDLAAELGVHHNTVAEAYRTLATEGWLELGRRRGATVLDREHPALPLARQRTQESHRLRHLVAELRSKGFSKDWIRLELLEALEVLP